MRPDRWGSLALDIEDVRADPRCVAGPAGIQDLKAFDFMKSREGTGPTVSGRITIHLEHGICASAARQLRERLQAFDSRATLENRRGRIANVDALLDVLLLEVTSGEEVRLQCWGPAASEAFRSLRGFLEHTEASDGPAP